MEGIEVPSIVEEVCVEPFSRNSEQLLNATNILKTLKSESVSKNDQTRAKLIWILETVIEVQQEYLEAFRLLKSHKFYEAWCQLEKCEISSEALFRHYRPLADTYHVKWIAMTVEQYQQLFPYKYFMSTELIELEKKCNICDKVVNIRSNCGHIVGEIYDGKYCIRIVTKVDLPAISLVETPVNKYAVPFFVDPETNQQKDNYSYVDIRFLIDKLDYPDSKWRFEKTKRVFSHDEYKNYDINNGCPCGSGDKYKNCCLTKPGIDGFHTQFYLEKLPSKN